MSRLHTPASIASSPLASRPLLETIKEQLGVTPNVFRVLAGSPASLAGYLGLNRALTGGQLDARTCERIALAVAEVNGCDYCLSFHAHFGKHVAELDDAEMAANREGWSQDAFADVAVRFATRVARQRGHVSDADVQAVKDAGYTDGQVIEIVMNVALNTLTNYVNEVAKTDIDFVVQRCLYRIETPPAPTTSEATTVLPPSRGLNRDRSVAASEAAVET